MSKAILRDKSVSRVEIDQRARDARLRLEQIERLLLSRAAVTASWLRRVLYLFSFGRRGVGSRTRRILGPLNNRRPRMPQIHQGRGRGVGRRNCTAASRAIARAASAAATVG
jgi:hypothetical protein